MAIFTAAATFLLVGTFLAGAFAHTDPGARARHWLGLLLIRLR